MNNKKLIIAFVHATNQRDWDTFDTLVSDQVVRHSSTAGQPSVQTKEQLKQFHKDEGKTFPDIREKIKFMICEDDMVAARITFKGTQLGPMGPYPPSGKKFEADFNCFFRVTDNKISEIWVEYDNLNGLIQLGHYKPPIKFK